MKYGYELAVVLYAVKDLLFCLYLLSEAGETEPSHLVIRQLHTCHFRI